MRLHEQNVVYIHLYVYRSNRIEFAGSRFCKASIYDYIYRLCRQNTSLMRMQLLPIVIELLIITYVYPPFNVISDHVPTHCTLYENIAYSST